MSLLWIARITALLWVMERSKADFLDDQMKALHEDKGWFSPDALDGSIASPHSRMLQDDKENAKLRAQLGSLTYAAHHFKPETNLRIVHYDHETAQAEIAGSIRAGLRKRCRHTRGKWCGRYDTQRPVPAKPTPRGSKACKGNCNNVGNCNYDLGVCDCPAGWKGNDCTIPEKRPCSNRGREVDPADLGVPTNHTDKDGRDLDWLKSGWMASRCAGICDDDTAQCWCDGKNDKYRHIPAPAGSPPGTPPVNLGRPLSEFCGKLRQDKDGKKTDWGNVDYSRVYGPKGWCEVDRPPEEGMCDQCQVDNLALPYCDTIKEAYCPNQCSGYGDCNLGFCKCHEGWYGLDCSRKVAGAAIEPNDVANGRKPWLRTPGLGQLPPAAAEVPSSPTRKRPLIYVYDSPPPYTTRMLQYRLVWKSCIWRHFNAGNSSELYDWLYGVETYFHEQMLASPHRTFDPEEADYFYVPLYVTCYFWPIIGWSDHPWWHSPKASPRPMHGANMMLDLKRWLESSFPFWKRRGGRDHIWLVAADEGACWMPTEIYANSIVLTHWGRLDPNHTSGTAFARDNYNEAHSHPKYQPTDWTELHKGHACYDPKKDLVIPSLKLPNHFSHSPLLGAEPLHRDILLFFKGDVGNGPRDPRYSRGIRQKLYGLSVKEGWREKHRIYILAPGEDAGPYSQLLARSTFCLVAPGDGWSARAEDAVLHGCLPVIVMDDVHVVYESILDWDAFSIRVKQASLEDIPAILKSISQDRIIRMQRRLALVWHRFAYATGPLLQGSIKSHAERNFNEMPANRLALSEEFPLQRVRDFPVQDDAFSTIMQWLYAKIPETRGTQAPAAAEL